MDALNELLINYGYIGILIATFLAASILPFSSEVVMVGLLAAGLDPAKCTLFVQSQVAELEEGLARKDRELEETEASLAEKESAIAQQRETIAQHWFTMT